MASELRVDTLKDASGANSVGLSYVANGSAKAWCSWNMNNTNTVENSFNVSSLSDNGTGTNGINFSNAMSGANDFCVTSSFYESTVTDSNVLKVDSATAPTASKIVMLGGEYQNGATNVAQNFELAYTVIHGDLA